MDVYENLLNPSAAVSFATDQRRRRKKESNQKKSAKTRPARRPVLLPRRSEAQCCVGPTPRRSDAACAGSSLMNNRSTRSHDRTSDRTSCTGQPTTKNASPPPSRLPPGILKPSPTGNRQSLSASGLLERWAAQNRAPLRGAL